MRSPILPPTRAATGSVALTMMVRELMPLPGVLALIVALVVAAPAGEVAAKMYRIAVLANQSSSALDGLHRRPRQRRRRHQSRPPRRHHHRALVARHRAGSQAARAAQGARSADLTGGGPLEPGQPGVAGVLEDRERGGPDAGPEALVRLRDRSAHARGRPGPRRAAASGRAPRHGRAIAAGRARRRCRFVPIGSSSSPSWRALPADAVEPKIRVWVVFDKQLKLGAGRAQLLRLIDERGSLRKAAAEFGMSYRNAWGYL